jgi:SOS-response transcriptional repressor LexA
MQKKLIPIVGKGYTQDFFDVTISDDELMHKPHLEVDGSHFATLAFELDDEGLSDWNLNKGDYLLFSSSSESVKDKLILVRSEERLIIRQALYITPDVSVLSTPGEIYPAIIIPSENIRIIGVMSGVIKPHDDLKIVSPDELWSDLG